MSVQLLEPKFVERVWGRTSLAPLFPDHSGNRIGEVWFDAGSNFPLLTKFLFTSERLSVQVHPDDDYAREVEGSRGKTEMWHILDAEPDATIALGFREEIGKQRLREAIEDGSVEQLLNIIPVKAGDTFFAAAGTVHAIGAGITLVEIQQNSDVTYRLYDYGRPRELHLDKGVAVANTGRYEGRRNFPVMCDHFSTELMELDGPVERSGAGVLIALSGTGHFGTIPVTGGQVCVAGDEPVRITPDGVLKLLHAKCGA